MARLLVRALRQNSSEVWIILGFFALAAMLSSCEAWLIGENILHSTVYGDTWFDSDVSAYFEWIESRLNGLHVRTYKHPLFSLILCVPVQALNAMGVELVVAIRLYIAAIAGLWLATFYVLLRVLGLHRFDAVLFTLIGINSAAAVFFFFGPESYSFGSLAILLSALIVALGQSRHMSMWSYIAVNVVTFGVTVTNSMAGGLATLLGNSKKRSLMVVIASFAVIMSLAYVQKLIFPSAVFPPIISATGRASREMAYVFSQESGGILHIVASFFFHSVVMPAIQIIPHPRTQEAMMVTQLSFPGSGSSLGAIAVILWVMLLGLGLWASFHMNVNAKFRQFLGLLLIGQFVLHLVYTGRETFLYALHFAPLLLITAALGALSKFRAWTLGLAMPFLVCIAINNGLMFNRAKIFYEIPDPKIILNTNLSSEYDEANKP